MVLRTLEMQGFKSFPDKTELNFGKGITAVVGPNGSGKSNISDAVRWVLGETSTKSLRGSKMEDVIFGGTSTRKALGFAQVQLTLDNSDETLKNKNEIVTVSRRYYRSGESEYKIDGEVVRRRDIRELFMDTGLGADGYSIVGQGKIDSIISAKNEDRRELFEEAAGISRFRHKRTDAQRRLEQAQENLVRLLDILAELESRVGPLKIQSEKAARFLELSGEKKELEIGVWLNKIERFTNELREQEHRIDAANNSYELCENEIKAIENEMEQIVSFTAKINAEIEDVRGSSQSFEEQALKKDSEAQVLLATVSHNEETVSRLNAEVNASDETGKNIVERIEEQEKIIEKKELLCIEKRNLLRQITSENEQLVSSSDDFSKMSVSLNAKINELTLKLSDRRVKSSGCLSSIEEITVRKNTVEQVLQNSNSQLKDAENQKANSQNRLLQLKQKIDENQNSLSGYQIRLKSKTDGATKINEEMQQLSLTLQQKNSRAKMLSDLEKNMDGFSGAVKAVINQSRAKALGGIDGILSQLISVDNEYSTAVEVALGAAMQNIVTNTEADAKRAIYYLKNNKLGRATFLPVSNIKGRTLDEKGLDDSFGFVDVANNLVSCDAKYKNIVSNLLGRTVVVDDMDCAIGMAKKYSNRLRIVTLDGQVINPGGSMSGGSRSKGAGVLSRSNQIDDLLKGAKKLETQLEEIKSKYKTAVEEANFAASELQGAESEMKTAKEDLIRAEGEHKLICEKLSALESQQNSFNQESENAAARIDALNIELKQSEQDSEEIKNQIDALQFELEKAGESATELFAKRDEIRSKSEQINLELVTLTKEIEAAKISKEDLQLRHSSESDRVKSIGDEIALIKTKNADIQSQIDIIEKDAQLLREKAKESVGDVQSKIEKRNELEKRSVELRNTERNKSAEREKLSGELVRLDERKNAMRKEFDELNDMLFEQYELTKREAQALNIVIENMTDAKKRLHEIKVEIKKLGSINVGAIEEYKEVAERYEFLKTQIDDIEKSKSELSKIIEDLTSSMSEKFLTQFNRINSEFNTSFADFFGGGKGEIKLENPENCLESAIEINIQPPGKSVQNINLFSGGEKSLAALALLFSVLKVTPSPFCIYDEVEAALDDVNVERFAKYMRRMTDKTQFISITHRRGTMEEADVLYGVTMQEKGVSKLLELQTAELAEKMGLEA